MRCAACYQGVDSLLAHRQHTVSSSVNLYAACSRRERYALLAGFPVPLSLVLFCMQPVWQRDATRCPPVSLHSSRWFNPVSSLMILCSPTHCSAFRVWFAYTVFTAAFLFPPCVSFVLKPAVARCLPTPDHVLS